MGMLTIFNISGSAASAQSQRLNVVASNLANADTVAGPNGQAYKARQVTFQTELMGQSASDATAAGVRVSTVSEDQTPGRRVHDPMHPSWIVFSRSVFAVFITSRLFWYDRDAEIMLTISSTALTLL